MLATLPRRFPPPAPRLPFVPDPLGRIQLPADLESLTTVGEEHDPESVD